MQSPIQQNKQDNRKNSGGWGVEHDRKVGGGWTKFEKGLGVGNIGGGGGGLLKNASGL